MNPDRRTVIKSAGALGATLLAPNLPMWARAEEEPSITAPDSFTHASAALLDVAADVLVPELRQDDISLADMYYDLCNRAMPMAVSTMLSDYQTYTTQGHSPQQIADLFLRSSGDPNLPNRSSSGAAARLTMMMWLFGVWYGGYEVQNLGSSADYIGKAYQTDFIVSSRAYKNAWIWRFAQAHPMGFSHFKFGSWAEQPPDLSNYTNPTG